MGGDELAAALERQALEYRAEDEAEGCESRFCMGWLLGVQFAADFIRANSPAQPAADQGEG